MKIRSSKKLAATAGMGAILVFICLFLGSKEPARSFMSSFIHRGPSLRSEEQSPNIIVIVMDTVRRDALSLYGNPRKTTPFIDAFAKRSCTFTNVRSTSSWTLPSHASMFTGLYSVSHGATQEHVYLEDEFRTLAEILGDKGYQTVGFSNNPLVGEHTNLAQGFDEFYDTWRVGGYKFHGQIINAKIKEWLQSGGAHQPFFMFINYMDAHRPFWPPRKYANLYTDKQLTPMVDLRINVMHFAKYTNKITYTQEDYDLMTALYHSEIRQLDDCIGQLISLLTLFQYVDNTAIIITSDHGENNGEHDHIHHVFNLYETTLRIPLIINHSPLFEPGSVNNHPIQLVDLFPTILAIAGIEPPVSSGINLADRSAFKDDRPVFAEYYYPKYEIAVFPAEDRDYPGLDRFKRRLSSIELGGRKLIYGSDGKHELYDLRNDPDELQNLVDSNQEELNSLLTSLQDYKKEVSQIGPRVSSRNEPQFDEQSRKALKSLGYMQ